MTPHERQCIAVLTQFTHILEGLGITPSIVYGGALRDILTGRSDEINDVDVAVPATAKDTLLIELGLSIDHELENMDYGNTDAVMWQFSHTMFGLDVNFIGFADRVMTVEGIANRCDFGICQVAMGSSGVIYRSPAFDKDAANKTFTWTKEHVYTLESTHGMMSRRRFERLTKQKFDGWRMIRGEE